jgi:hypothetical protein
MLVALAISHLLMPAGANPKSILLALFCKLDHFSAVGKILCNNETVCFSKD